MEWTIEEAKAALDRENGCRRRSVMIRFPDQELDRDLVSNFHSSIEGVLLPQSTTPRHCFVTLAETADADAVIEYLNRTKFGDGFLRAQYKDMEEETDRVEPRDIDPLTLHIGKLERVVTMQELVKMYPKCKNIDFGYSQERNTRYALIVFKTCTEALDAFERSQALHMYSMTFVKFKRLRCNIPAQSSKGAGEPSGSNI